MPLPSSVKSHGSSKDALQRARMQSQALREARAANRASTRENENPEERNDTPNSDFMEEAAIPDEAITEPGGGRVVTSTMAEEGQARSPNPTAEHLRSSVSADQVYQPPHGTKVARVDRLEEGVESRLQKLQSSIDTVRQELMTARNAAGDRDRVHERNYRGLDLSFQDLNKAFGNMMMEVEDLTNRVTQTDTLLKEALNRLSVVEGNLSRQGSQKKEAAMPNPPPSPIPFPVFEAEGVAPKAEEFAGAANQMNNPTPNRHRRNTRRDEIITVADSPTTLPAPQVEAKTEDLSGSYAPGLHPKKTFVDSFASLVDYRTYRLSNTSATMTLKESKNVHTIKRLIEQRLPNFETFSGRDGMFLFAFLSDLVEAFEYLEVSEALAVNVLGLYLTDSAKTLYQSHVRFGRSTSKDGLRGTWPFIIHSLIDRFIDDDLLNKEKRVVTDARQREDESVEDFARRLEEASDRCRHVFSQTELVHNFVLGLHPATKALVQTHLDQAPAIKDDFLGVKRLAERCDKTAKTLAPSASTPRVGSSSKSLETRKTKTPKTTVMHIPAMATALPSPPSTPASSDITFDKLSQLRDAEKVDTPHSGFPLKDYLPKLEEGRLGDVITRLEEILLVDEPTSAPLDEASEKMRGIIAKMDFSERNLCREHVPVPTLTEKQVAQAMSAIPADYWTLSCWTCRESGHSAFTCPSLTIAQRIFFAYCYYRYQVASNPRMADWFQMRADHRAGKASEPGPKPLARQSALRRGSTSGNRDGRRTAFVIPEEQPEEGTQPPSTTWENDVAGYNASDDSENE